jgi:hypothetical protein
MRRPSHAPGPDSRRIFGRRRPRQMRRRAHQCARGGASRAAGVAAQIGDPGRPAPARFDFLSSSDGSAPPYARLRWQPNGAFPGRGPKEVDTRAAELVKRSGLGHRNQRERGLGGVRAVPGAVWIKVWISHLGEGAMYVLTIQKRRRSVSRGAHERMTKSDPSAELDQPRCLGHRGALVPDAEPTHGAPQQRVVAARLGRGREEHPPRLDRKRGSSRRRRPSSMRLASGIVSVSPNPNANSAGESPRGSSSNAKGLPRVSATIRSRTC